MKKLNSFVNKNKGYFSDTQTDKLVAESIYLGLGVAFILLLVDIIFELLKNKFEITTSLGESVFKLVLVIIFISIYGWSAAEERNKMKK